MTLPKDGALLRIFVGEIVDVREKLEAFLDDIEGHVPEGLATLEKAFVRFYRGGRAR